MITFHDARRVARSGENPDYEKKMKIPGGPDELTVDWLSTVLRSPVGAFQITSIGGWRGDVFRLSFPDRSLIVKLSSARPKMRERSVGLYNREVRFYRELAEGIALKVPTCLYADINEKSGKHVLVLEDVGRSLRRSEDCSAEQAKLAAQQITRFHAQYWGKSEGWEPEHPVDIAASITEHEDSWPEFLRRAGHAIPAEMRELGARLGSNLHLVIGHVFEPQTLIHRDYNKGNMTFDPFCVLDWQSIQPGTAAFDLAYFLTMDLETESRRAIEPMLFDHYVETIRGYSLEQCRTDYGYGLLYRFSSMITGLANLPFERRMLERDIEVRLPRICAAVMDNGVHEFLM